MSLSKSEQAYVWLKERISRREYSPGYRLAFGVIASTLEMSIVPVREAIRRLEAEGLVEFEHNVGARVSLVNENEYVHTMQTLGIVEGAATALSAPLLSATALDEADGINQRMCDQLRDFNPHAFTADNYAFHAVLFAPCPNPHLLDLVHRGWSRLAILRDSSFAFVPERAQASVNEHRNLVNLIRNAQSYTDIEHAAREHRWATMDALVNTRNNQNHPA